jgi:hypothetical protein
MASHIYRCCTDMKVACSRTPVVRPNCSTCQSADYKLDINCHKMDLCAQQIIRIYIKPLCWATGLGQDGHLAALVQSGYLKSIVPDYRAQAQYSLSCFTNKQTASAKPVRCSHYVFFTKQFLVKQLLQLYGSFSYSNNSVRTSDCKLFAMNKKWVVGEESVSAILGVALNVSLGSTGALVGCIGVTWCGREHDVRPTVLGHCWMYKAESFLRSWQFLL